MQEPKSIKNETVNSRFAVIYLFVVSTMLPILVGYHLAWMSPVMLTLQIGFNQTFQNRYTVVMPETTWTTILTLATSTLIIGCFIGGVSFKYILKYISSKRTAQLCHLINIIAVLITALAGGLTLSYETFIIGRLLAGIACGIAWGLSQLLVAEMSAKTSQTFWQSMIGISIAFGCALAVIISHPKILGGQGRWPIAISLVVIPSLIYLTASARFPETTYYLIRNGHKSEAVLVLQRMRDGQVKSEMEKIEAEINIASTQLGIRQIYRTQQYRNQLYAVCALLANLMFTGFNCFILYMDLVFIDAGIPKDRVTYATIGVFSLQIVTTCLLSRLMLRFGGRKLCILANSGIIFSLVLFTVSQATRHLQSAAVMSYFAIVAVALHLTCTNGLTIAQLAIISEITIEPTRATCVSVGNVILWISSWLVGFLAPYLQEYLKAYSVTPWLGCTILFLIYIVIFIPDTKEKSTDEIQAKFRGKQIFRSKQPPSSLSSVC